MWTYSSNCMGPMKHWYITNKIPFNEETNSFETHYSGGRIDCYCDDVDDTDYSRYGQELPLLIMEDESFILFSDFLDIVSSSDLLSFDDLKELFEERFNFKLHIFKEQLSR